MKGTLGCGSLPADLAEGALALGLGEPRTTECLARSWDKADRVAVTEGIRVHTTGSFKEVGAGEGCRVPPLPPHRG